MSAQSHRDALAFRALHEGPGFVLPNAWDAGSARVLAGLGFPAVATTSAGIAWSCGVPDGGVLGAERMLDRVAEIVRRVRFPSPPTSRRATGPTPRMSRTR